MRHGFQRWQTESFIQRGEHEDLGLIVKDAQHFDRHKAEKPHIVLHPAFDHRAPKVGMFGYFIADDDQLQVFELPFLGQLSLERSERLYDAHDVLVRADAACIEQERVVHLVTLRDESAVGFAGMPLAEAVVEGVVNDLDLLRRNMEQALRVLLGEIGDREDACRVMQHPLGKLKMQVALHVGMAVDAVHMVEQVMHRDHVRARDTLRFPEQMWHMQQVAAEAFQQLMQFKVALKRELVRLRRQRLEVRRQSLGPDDLSRDSDQEVFVFAVQARQRTDGVARIGPNAKFADPPDVDRDSHNTSVNRGANRKATTRGCGLSDGLDSLRLSPPPRASPGAKRKAETLPPVPT